MSDESQEKPSRKNYALLAYELPYLEQNEMESVQQAIKKDPYAELKESKQPAEEQPKYVTKKDERKKTQKMEYNKKPDNYSEYFPRKRKEEKW